MGSNESFFSKVIEGVKSPRKAWSYLGRIEPIYFATERKISHDDRVEFGRKFANDKETLIVYEFPWDDLHARIPDATQLPNHHGDYDRYLDELANIETGGYEQIVAVGVLEHVTDPEAFLDDCYRILKDDGVLFVSASSTFSIHCGPEDYFHVTHYGMEQLLEPNDWSELEIEGSCGPFKTIGILLQRILLQSRTRFFIRPFVSVLAYMIPVLDRFVIVQYHGRSFEEGDEIDSMMPSNIELIARK